jgi:hypothetical protein
MSAIPRCGCCDSCGGPADGEGTFIRCGGCEKHEVDDVASWSMQEMAALRAECVRLREERDATRAGHQWEMGQRAACLEQLARVRAALEGTPESIKAVARVLYDDVVRWARNRRINVPDFAAADWEGRDEFAVSATAILTALRERCFGDAESKEESRG